jgi:hypothetical protein
MAEKTCDIINRVFWVSGAYFCYVNELQAGREFLTYSNYIFTEFDYCRIATIGKLCLHQLRYPANIPPIPRSFKKIPDLSRTYPAGFNKVHTPPTLQIGKRYPAASCK